MGGAATDREGSCSFLQRSAHRLRSRHDHPLGLIGKAREPAFILKALLAKNQKRAIILKASFEKMSQRRDAGFIYLLFRRKLMLHCIPRSLPTPSPNESPAKRVSFGKGGTRSSVAVTAQARPHDLMALFGRNKRYNTLDLASKIVCQRQAFPALLWKPPGYRQSHF